MLEEPCATASMDNNPIIMANVIITEIKLVVIDAASISLNILGVTNVARKPPNPGPSTHISRTLRTCIRPIPSRACDATYPTA